MTRLGCHVAVAFLVMLAGASFDVARGETGASAATATWMEEIGTLERIPDDAIDKLGTDIRDHPSAPAVGGTMIVLPEVRQLWQLYRVSEGNQEATQIVVRDLDTLRIARTLRLAAFIDRAGAPMGGDWIYAVDAGKRLFLLGTERTLIAETDGNKAVFEIDLGSFEVTRRPFNNKVEEGPVPLLVGGLEYDPHGDALWAVLGFGGGAAAGSNLNTFLVRLDLATGTRSDPRPLRACSGPFQGTSETETLASPPVIASAEHLLITCQRSGTAAIVLRLDRAVAVNPSSPEVFAVGPTGVETAMGDPPSGRIFVATKAGEIWAFNTTSMSFVGVVSARRPGVDDPRIGYGIDSKTGRLFFQSASYGFGVVEGRFFPIPQARTDLGADLGRKRNGQERIWSDSATGRVFVLEDNPRSDRYRIYRLDPAPTPPAGADPDANTIDRAEEAGMTEVRFLGKGSGYGARVLLANGVTGAVPSPGATNLSPVAQILVQANSKCGFIDRELFAGRVAKAELDTFSSAADAVAVGVDSRTRVDLERPSRCDVVVKQGAGSDVFSGLFATQPVGPMLAGLVDQESGDDPRWNRDPAVCSASAGGDAETAVGDDHGSPPLGDARVLCPAAGGALSARAETRLVGQVTVAQAWSDVRVWRDAQGIHTRSEAAARGIELPNDVRIGEVRSLAESDARGRPHAEPMSRHVVSIRSVSIGETTVCEDCDLEQVLATLNLALAGQAEFRIGVSRADANLVEGTPGGALTAVKKSEERQVSDRALTGDFTVEIPGLEMITYNDTAYWGRARQLYQFAGISASANYSIALRPPPLNPIPRIGGSEATSRAKPLPTLPSAPPPTAAPTVHAEQAIHPIEAGGLTAEIGEAPDGAGGSFVEQAVDALGRGLRLIWAHPREALLVLTGWLLFWLPALLAHRRRALNDVEVTLARPGRVHTVSP